LYCRSRDTDDFEEYRKAEEELKKFKEGAKEKRLDDLWGGEAERREVVFDYLMKEKEVLMKKENDWKEQVIFLQKKLAEFEAKGNV